MIFYCVFECAGTLQITKHKVMIPNVTPHMWAAQSQWQTSGSFGLYCWSFQDCKALVCPLLMCWSGTSLLLWVGLPSLSVFAWRSSVGVASSQLGAAFALGFLLLRCQLRLILEPLFICWCWCNRNTHIRALYSVPFFLWCMAGTAADTRHFSLLLEKFGSHLSPTSIRQCWLWRSLLHVCDCAIWLIDELALSCSPAVLLCIGCALLFWERNNCYDTNITCNVIWSPKDVGIRSKSSSGLILSGRIAFLGEFCACYPSKGYDMPLCRRKKLHFEWFMHMDHGPHPFPVTRCLHYYKNSSCASLFSHFHSSWSGGVLLQTRKCFKMPAIDVFYTLQEHPLHLIKVCPLEYFLYTCRWWLA